MWSLYNNNRIDPSVLLADNFNGDLSHWSVSAGTWSIQQGKLLGVGAGGNIDAWIYAGDPTWSDYVYTADADLTNGEAELVVRSTGHWQNEYRVHLWSHTGAYPDAFNILRYKGGVLTGMITNAVAPFPIPNKIHVRVEAIGATLRLFINDVLFATCTDPDPLLYGRVGLGVIWSYQANFDNVIVQRLTDGPPLTTATLTPQARSDTTYPDLVTVTLTAALVAGQSLAATTFSVDGGISQTYSAPFVVSGNGVHTVRYW